MTKLIKAGEVAEMMDIKEDHVYALARQGIIPTVRLGRRLRFSPEQIQDFIENGGRAWPGGWRREE